MTLTHSKNAIQRVNTTQTGNWCLFHCAANSWLEKNYNT